MALQLIPLVPTNFDGNRYLLNEDDPMDTRGDYDDFGLVGSAQATWAWQQIIRPGMEKFGYSFVEPAFALVQIPGRGVGFVATPPVAPVLAPAAAPILPTLPTLSSLPTLPSLPSLPPPVVPTSTPSPPQQQPTVSSTPAGGRKPSKFFSSLGDNFNISSGPIRQLY